MSITQYQANSISNNNTNVLTHEKEVNNKKNNVSNSVFKSLGATISQMSDDAEKAQMAKQKFNVKKSNKEKNLQKRSLKSVPDIAKIFEKGSLKYTESKGALKLIILKTAVQQLLAEGNEGFEKNSKDILKDTLDNNTDRFVALAGVRLYLTSSTDTVKDKYGDDINVDGLVTQIEADMENLLIANTKEISSNLNISDAVNKFVINGENEDKDPLRDLYMKILEADGNLKKSLQVLNNFVKNNSNLLGRDKEVGLNKASNFLINSISDDMNSLFPSHSPEILFDNINVIKQVRSLIVMNDYISKIVSDIKDYNKLSDDAAMNNIQMEVASMSLAKDYRTRTLESLMTKTLGITNSRHQIIFLNSIKNIAEDIGNDFFKNPSDRVKLKKSLFDLTSRYVLREGTYARNMNKRL